MKSKPFIDVKPFVSVVHIWITYETITVVMIINLENIPEIISCHITMKDSCQKV